MAKEHGVAGGWAWFRGMVCSIAPLFVAFVLVVALGVSFVADTSRVLFIALSAVVAVAVFLYWKKGIPRVENFFQGAKGEEITAALLSSLPDDYHVFNDFRSEGELVDHVVVGPAGVFSVETKCWSGKVELSGDRVIVNGKPPSRDPVAQALREADKVRSSVKKSGFDVTVTPLVCFASNTFAVSGGASCGSVKLLNSGDILDWFKTRGEVLPKNEVDRLVRVLETVK